ncbi:MAG: hypothetical protein ABIH04_03100 [Planctomycetota bacterium]
MTVAVERLFSTDENVEREIVHSMLEPASSMPCQAEAAESFCEAAAKLLEQHFQMIRLLTVGRPRSWQELQSILRRLLNTVEDVWTASRPVQKELGVYDSLPEFSPYVDFPDDAQPQINSRVKTLVLRFLGGKEIEEVLMPIFYHLLDLQEELVGASYCIAEMGYQEGLTASDYLWIITEILSRLQFHAIPNHVLDTSEETPGLLTLLTKLTECR